MTSATTDPVTLALTGMLPFVVIAAAVLAFPASALLLRLYRRAVLRAMSESRGQAVPVSPTLIPPGAAATPLRIVSLGASAALSASLPGPWRAVLVYAAAGGAFAAIMTAAWLLSTHDREIGPVKLFFLFWTYAWPATLAVNLVAAEDRARRSWMVAILSCMPWNAHGGRACR